MIRPLLTAVCLLSFLPGICSAEVHTFTTADGKSSVRASIEGLEPDTTGDRVAILRREDTGKVVRVKLSQLAKADAHLILTSAQALPPAIANRFSAEKRADMRRAAGSDPFSEDAIERGLDWLAKNQNPNGSWGKRHVATMTGLSLLAFNGQGHTAASPKFGDAIRRGTVELLRIASLNQPPFTGMLSTTPSVISSTYEHAIATQALAEVYLSTPPLEDTSALAKTLTSALAIIIEKQNKEGSWGYKDGIGYDPFGRNDLSLTGWQLQALAAGQRTGLKIQNLAQAMKKASRYLQSSATADGGIGAPSRDTHYNQWNLTGSALCGLQETGPTLNPKTLSNARFWLLDQLKREPLDWNRGCYLYTWYWNTMAFYHDGGPAWTLWNSQCEKLTLASQQPDGSWKSEGVGEVGAAGSSAAGADANIYRACLAMLILETPVRVVRPAAK